MLASVALGTLEREIPFGREAVEMERDSWRLLAPGTV